MRFTDSRNRPAELRTSRSRSHRRGFTLIELMVVVVIIAIIAAIAIPIVIGAMEESQPKPQRSPAPAAPIALSAPEATVGTDDNTRRTIPIGSTDIAVQIHPYPVLNGVQVVTQFDASLTGTFTLANDEPDPALIRLNFPFPPGITEARDVRLSRRGPNGFAEQTAGVQYALDAIHYEGVLEPKSITTFRIAYSVRGRDRFVYAVAGANRTGEVRVKITLPDAFRAQIPFQALEPTERTDETIRWDYDHLISTHPIVVDLPAAASPLGQLVLLCQLAALGVLLFGMGYWYLGELQKPGSLDGFRWGHFLLLALNYSSFFAVFAVLGYSGKRDVALGVAALVSQPLLILHASRLSTLRFAVLQVLPLSVLTLATVVAGVYLDEVRPYVFLSLGVICIGAVTLTYRRWAAGQVALKAARKLVSERFERDRQLKRSSDELAKLDGEAVSIGLQARRWMLEQGDALAKDQGALASAQAAMESALKEARAGCGVAPIEPAAHEVWIRESLVLVAHRSWLLKNALAGVSEAIRRVEERSKVVRELSHVPPANDARCLACGAPLSGDGKFCAKCGVLRPTRLACDRCDMILDLPEHLLVPKWTAKSLHCRSCGAALATPMEKPGQESQIAT
jgi:prepilin-type N-terminal cleavage/methylation domain-containing protein